MTTELHDASVKEMRVCNSCLWFVDDDPESNIGQCFRYPPQIARGNVMCRPSTHRLDFCGEWVRRGE
jgi:hypothetical protein